VLLDGDGGQPRHAQGCGLGFLHQPVGRHHPVDETHAQRLGGVDAPAEEQELLRMLHAEHPGHDEERWGRAELDLRLAELRRVGSHRVVAGHGQVAAAAEAIAVHGRHDRKARAPHAQPRLVAVLGVVAPVLHARARLFPRRDVEAGAECLAGAGDDQRPDVVVALASVHGSAEVGEQLIGEGVHLLRAVQGEDGERAVLLELDRGVGHDGPLFVDVKGAATVLTGSPGATARRPGRRPRQMTAMASTSMSQPGMASAVTPTRVEAGARLPKNSSRMEANSARCRMSTRKVVSLTMLASVPPPASTWAFKALNVARAWAVKSPGCPGWPFSS